jgi:hypothetical protein
VPKSSVPFGRGPPGCGAAANKTANQNFTPSNQNHPRRPYPTLTRAGASAQRVAAGAGESALGSAWTSKPTARSPLRPAGCSGATASWKCKAQACGNGPGLRWPAAGGRRTAKLVTPPEKRLFRGPTPEFGGFRMGTESPALLLRQREAASRQDLGVLPLEGNREEPGPTVTLPRCEALDRI